MAKVTAVAPVLLVKDVVASANYFRDCCGFEFELHNEPPDFAICWRDHGRLMLAQCDNPTPPHWKVVDKTWNVYFWVDDADAIYADFIANGAKIDYKLHNKPNGVREFGIQDLDEHDIAFGQVL